MKVSRALLVGATLLLTCAVLGGYLYFAQEGRRPFWWLFAVDLGLGAIVIVYGRWRASRWDVLYNLGLFFGHVDMYREAALYFSEAEQFAITRKERVLPEFNRATCLMLEGRFEAALGVFIPLSHSRRAKVVPEIFHRLPTAVATCFALQGSLVQAGAWLMDARDQCREEEWDKLLLTEVLFLLRAERFQAADLLLEVQWTAVQELALSRQKLLLVAQAFTRHALGDGGVQPESLAAIPGDVSFLGMNWPEMHGFLEANGLLGRRASLPPPEVFENLDRPHRGTWQAVVLHYWPLVLACALVASVVA